MLVINQLNITDSKNHKLIQDFSFSLGNHDKVAIIGEEGNGKTTLLKAIYHPDWILSYTQMSGKIDMDFKHIAYLHQKIEDCWNPCFIYEYLLKENIEEEIEVETYNELSYYQELCNKVHLSTSFIERDQQIATLSGGEKVKLQLLKILRQNPDLLLLDEPTNDLDTKTLKFLEDFILKLNIPILFISHDETLLSKCANRIIHLEQLNKKTKCKHTIFNGNYENYIQTRKQLREKEIKNANKEKEEYLKQQKKLNDIRNAVHDAQNAVSRQNPGKAKLLKKKMHNIKAMEHRFEKESYQRIDDIEEAIDIYFNEFKINKKHLLHYQKEVLSIEDKVLLKDINIDIYANDKIVICGDNGSGKSLLLRNIYDALKNKQLNIGYMPQNYAILFNKQDTPITFLAKSHEQKDITRARELLGRMKFTSEEMENNVNELSEGQKAKLYLIYFIYRDCEVLLLDEPTRNISPLTNPVIRSILKKYQGCIISISHDRKYIEEVGEIIYEIEHQRLKKTKAR